MKALRIIDTDDGPRGQLSTVGLPDLGPGDVVIRTVYSSLNYKDALAVTGAGKIARKRPLTAGIDVSGVVESSDDSRFSVGDEVLVTGWFLGEQRDGGLAEYVRVPSDCVTRLPQGLSLWEAMALGTAGFTVGMAIEALRRNGQRPEQGPVLVTGASGGVGNLAVNMLAQAGFSPVAVTRRVEQQGDALRALGAVDVIAPDSLDLGGKPFVEPTYAGAIDALGGQPLADLLGRIMPYGNVATIGLAAGPKLETTVMPFILRGVSLLGIHSVECPTALRESVWAALADELKPSHLEQIAARTIGLDEVPAACQSIIEGSHNGRTMVDLAA